MAAHRSSFPLRLQQLLAGGRSVSPSLKLESDPVSLELLSQVDPLRFRSSYIYLMIDIAYFFFLVLVLVLLSHMENTAFKAVIFQKLGFIFSVILI
jgi:hypothetical protein